MNNEQEERFARFTDIQELAQRPFMCMDLLQMILSDKLGDGSYRAVFDYGPNDTDYVIKVSYDAEANYTEMAIWSSIQDIPYISKWFAPCIMISPGGHFLMQRKVSPLPEDYKLPKNIPQFFTDLKPQNYGLLDNKFVCTDYHFLDRAMDYSMAAKRPAKWRTGKTAITKKVIKGVS